MLSNFEFKTVDATGISAQVQVFAWDSNGPTGAALFTSQVFVRSNAIEDFQVLNMNLLLAQGSLYGAVIDNFGYTGQSEAFNLNQNSYNGGNMWLVSQDTPNQWNNYASFGYNLAFQATFVPNSLTPPSGTPEPASYVLIGGGLVAFATFRKRLA